MNNKQNIKFNLIIRQLAIAAFCCLLLPCTAQERLAISTTDSEQPSVLLKWFDERFIFPEGVNIYRTDVSTGQRIKLNDRPIRKGDYRIPVSAFANDTTLQQYQEILDAMTPRDIEGIISALLLVKALQSTPFSLYAGIMFEDTKAEINTTYTYEIFRLVNGREVLIERSKPIRVERFQPDNAPADVDVNAGDSRVFIRWKPEALRFWGVNVYRQTEGEDTFVRINSEPIMISLNENERGEEVYPDIFVTDENLRNGIIYTYRIAGIDFFSRETQWSEPISVMPKDNTPPLPVTDVRAEFRNFNIEITWNADFKSADLKGYYIYRSRGRQGELIRITPELLDKESTSYTDIGVKEAGTYHYFVASVDSSGNEAKSFRAVVEVLDVFPPAPPTNFRVEADTGRMILTWENPTDPDFAGIRIFRTTNSDRRQAYALLNTRLIRDTIFIDTLPKNASNVFFYRIAALDSSLNMSEFTEAGFGRMPDVTPPSPPFLRRIEQEGEAIVLHWDISPESDVEMYIIYRFETNDSAATYRRLNRLDLPQTTTLFTDRMVRHRTEYAYEMVAVDSSGNVSELSAQKRLVFLSERTDLYTFNLDISVRRNGRRVRLNWNIDTDQTLDFMVFKRRQGRDEFVSASTLTKERRFTDTSLEKGQRYEYQIRAYSTDGDVFRSNTRWAERTR
jgi:fibronectin type 3 domain-containing protein